MPRPGPKRKVSDLRLMLELFIQGDGARFAAQIHEQVPLETTQGVRDRLNELVDTTEYVEKNTVSGRNLYRLTDTGEDFLVDELRARIS